MDLFPGRRHIKLDMNENKTLRGRSIASSNYTSLYLGVDCLV